MTLGCLRPLQIDATTELQNRNTVALPPKPVIIPQVGPEVIRSSWISARVQSEVMSVLVWECCGHSFPQPQECLVESIPSNSWYRRMWSDRTPSCTISIHVVTKRVGHEEVDHFRRQKLRMNLRVSLSSQISPFHYADIEMNPAGCVFAPRLFLIVLERSNFGFA